MDLSEIIFNKLLQRGYNYVDSGSFDYSDWKQKMYAYLQAYNDLFGLEDAEIFSLINDVWTTLYKIDGAVHTIGEWAKMKSDSTKCQQEMRNSIDRLFRAIEDFRTSSFFIELLKFCAKFKVLAPYNAMMVKTQMPSAKYVLTDRNWEKNYERRPKRNARPLVILRKYGPVDYVFEISDTEPIPGKIFPYSDEQILNSLANPYATTGNIQQSLYENLIHSLPYYGIDLDKFRVAASFGAEIRKAPCEVMVNGVKAEGHYVISVNEKADNSIAFASICHELGHFFCYHLTAPKKGAEDWWTWRRLSWAQMEFEAEIVSFIICERYGVGNKSWEYLSHVLGQNGVIPDGISIDRVFKAANEVERMLNKDLDPRTCLLYYHDRQFKKRYDVAHPQRTKSSEEDEQESSSN